MALMNGSMKMLCTMNLLLLNGVKKFVPLLAVLKRFNPFRTCPGFNKFILDDLLKFFKRDGLKIEITVRAKHISAFRLKISERDWDTALLIPFGILDEKNAEQKRG